jgi:hypothetical protein
VDNPRSDQLLLDENGLGHHGSGAARAVEPGDRRQQMEKQDGQIAHGPILTSRRNPRNARTFGIRQQQTFSACAVSLYLKAIAS